MTTELVAYKNANLAERRTYAQTLASAGDLIPKGLWAPVRKEDGSMGPPAPSPGKVLLVMETGDMLGIHPVAALQGVNVIEGKATVSPALMTAVIRNAGHRIRVDVHGSIEAGDIRAVAKLTRSDEPDEPYIVEWTIADAIRAGLVQSYQPDAAGVWQVRARSKEGHAKPWEAYTRSMLKNRALSEVARDGAQDVLMGAGYTPEELGAEVTGEGVYVPADEPTVDRSEEWKARIDAATTKAEVEQVIEDAKAAGEFTDDIRSVGLARYGVLGREEARQPVDAEPVIEESPEPTEQPQARIPRPTVNRAAFAHDPAEQDS